MLQNITEIPNTITFLKERHESEICFGLPSARMNRFALTSSRSEIARKFRVPDDEPD